jgi:hypothetical protein
MQIDELVAKSKKVRDTFHEVLATLMNLNDEIKDFSFTGIANKIPEVKDCLDLLEKLAKSERISGEMEPEFVCAFVGNSNSGKSSILEELFPDLAKRGWLPSQVSDTTSQILKIKCASLSQTPSSATIYPWAFQEISNLVNMAHKKCKLANIVIRNNNDSIEIDGSDSTIDQSIKGRYKFGFRQTIKPFHESFAIPTDDANDAKYILHLITKVGPQIDPLWNITLSNNRYHSLLLRPVVKHVEVYDNFDKISKWCDNEIGKYSKNIAFLDTPGLKTGGSENDEILGYVLENKNTQSIIHSLQEDELDVVVCLALIPNQTDAFAALLDSVAQSCNNEEIEDIDTRLIIALNGFHRYCVEPDLVRVREDKDAANREGDPFAITIKSNILSKLNIRKQLNPAAIVFVDAKKYAQSNYQNKAYVDIYREITAKMLKCIIPNESGYRTLEELGLLSTASSPKYATIFEENLAHLSDPNDCGVGYLIIQIAKLIKANGPKYYIRKFLRKSGLIEGIQKLRLLLSEYYDGTGKLNSKNISTSVRSCLHYFLVVKNLDIIDIFCAKHLDPRIDAMEFEIDSVNQITWVKDTFKKLCKIVLDGIISSARLALNKDQRDLASDDMNVFSKYFSGFANRWFKDWGYSRQNIPAPSANDSSSWDMIRHSMKYHAREMIFELASRDPDNQGLENLIQSPEDQKIIKTMMDKLKDASDLAESLFRQHGVKSI